MWSRLMMAVGIGVLAAPRLAADDASADAPSSNPVPSTAPATRPATRPALPSTTPATRPATRPLELSTPRDALRALSHGLHGGDAGMLRGVLLPASASEAKMVSAMAEMAEALVNLHRSAAAAFGDGAAARFTGNGDDQLAENLARIESAEIVVAGDGASATARYAGAKEPGYLLTRVAGRWHVPAAQFCQGADGAALERAVDETHVQVGVVRNLAREVSAGRYRTADAAGEAWHGKVMQALAAKPAKPAIAATRPDTAPGTRPARVP